MGMRDAEDRAYREREQRKAAGKSNFNAEKTRHIGREFLGWVCYEGRTGADGNFVGQRVGVTASQEDAERWLAGADDVKWDIPADPFGNLVDTNGSSR